MKKEFYIFLTAVMFYTRIPCPAWIDHSDDNLNKATRYFPVIGYIVGAISFLVGWLSSFIFPVEIAVILTLVAGILTTGAFHEDGLADFFDGFGGGWTKEKILDIMKDSRVGTYGMVATILQLAIKFYAILTIFNLTLDDPLLLLGIFIITHALARGTAIQVSYFIPYVREDELSKAKPIAKKHTKVTVWLTIILSIAPIFLLIQWSPMVFLILLPLPFLIWYFTRYLKKWLGGYTGDCLGAVEQIAEVVIFSSFTVLWKFI